MLRHCSSGIHHQHRQSVAPAAPATMAASTTFSLFFPLPNSKAQCAVADGFDDDSHSSVTTSPSSPSSSSTGSVVDCTLSLGTPSSRRAAAQTAKQHAAAAAHPASASSCGAVSWDVAADQSYYCCCQGGGGRPSAAATANKAGAGHGPEPMLVDRRCANCGTSSTPLWRNGPRGPKSLCNACGIRFKKEERRAAATAAMDPTAECGYFAQRAQQYGATATAGMAAPYGSCEGSAFPCADAEAVPPPFLAWRLNVVAPAPPAAWPQRASLFQYN